MAEQEESKAGHSKSDVELWKEYEIVVSGYHSRDEVVSQTFFEMMQVYTFLLILISAADVVINEKVLFLFYFVLSFTGLIALFAFLLDLQGNASARRALRIRCCELEDEMQGRGPSYWGSIRERDKYFEERMVKPNLKNSSMERLASSDFFVIAARLVTISWIVYAIAFLVNKL